MKKDEFYEVKFTTMKKATYFNRATKETYTISNIKNIGQAWNLAAFVCSRTGWNFEMFSYDVKVSIN